MAAVCFEFLNTAVRVRLTAFHQILILMGEKRISEVHTGGVQGKQTFPIAFDVIVFLKKKNMLKSGPKRLVRGTTLMSNF